MIAWWWLIPAFVGGGIFCSFVLLIVLAGAAISPPRTQK